MQVILEANGLWKMIGPYLTTEVDTKKDKTAIAYIYESLPEDQLLLISKYKTAKPVWDALKKRHVREDRVRYKVDEYYQQSSKQDVFMVVLTNHEAKKNNIFRSKRKKWESSQNNFKNETESNPNKFTHDKSKVLCFKCKEYGHFANKCPSKKEEQSNLIREDLEPTLLMATIEEAPGSFINQEDFRSKNGRKFHSASN
nr:zinc finger, CCHC-type [Tanacetum cinerariifolium]